MKNLLLFCVVAAMAVAVFAVDEKVEEELMSMDDFRAEMIKELKRTHPPRKSMRSEIALDSDSADRAALFFRMMDSDSDKKISAEDAKANFLELQQNLPGVSLKQFEKFISSADRDGDSKLSQREFIDALSLGAKEVAKESPQFLELQNTDAATSRKGAVKPTPFTPAKASKMMKEKLAGMMRKYTGKVNKQDDGCVLCQYIVERCEINLHAAGIFPGPVLSNDIIGENYHQGPLGVAAFVEESSTAKAKQFVSGVDFAGAFNIAGTRQTTRTQRLMERQKYNEIYRLVDVTLDDVCEQSMPNEFYGYCKMVYQTQSEVVDGLRFQYRAPDICYRVGMCGSNSYITLGVHARYADHK